MYKINRSFTSAVLIHVYNGGKTLDKQFITNNRSKQKVRQPVYSLSVSSTCTATKPQSNSVLLTSSLTVLMNVSCNARSNFSARIARFSAVWCTEKHWKSDRAASFQPQLQTRREALWRHITNPAPWSYGSEMIHLNHINVQSPAV